MANEIKVGVEIEADDAIQTIKNLEKSLKNMSKEGVNDFKKMDKATASFVGNLGAIAAVKVFDFLREQLLGAADAFIKFETGVVAVGKTTNFTNKEIEQFTENIEGLAKEIPASTDELLNIAEAAGQLGVTGVGDVTLFTETIAKLGRVSNLEGAEAATTLTRILNVTRENIDTIDTFASVIVSLGNNFAASESDIASMTSEVARATGIFGVSSSEAAALAATLTSVGVRAEEAGGVMSKSFIAIENAVKGGGEALNQLAKITGLTGAEVQKQFGEEPIKLFRNFSAGLGRITESGGNVNKVLEEFGLSGVRIAKVLPVLGKNVSEFDRALALANAEVKDATALNQEYEKTLDLTETKLKLFNNATDQLARDLSGSLAPAFNNILDVTTAFLEKLTAGNEVESAKANIKGLAATIQDVGDTTTFVNGLIGGEDSFLGRINRSFADDRIKRMNDELLITKATIEDFGSGGNALTELEQQIINAEDALVKLNKQKNEDDDGFFSSIFGDEKKTLNEELDAIREAEIALKKLKLQRAEIQDLRGAQAAYEIEQSEKEKEAIIDKAETEKKVVEDKNAFLQELEVIKRENAQTLKDEDALNAQLENDENLQFLADNLGKETTLRELNRIKNIQGEAKQKAALAKLQEKADAQSRLSIVNLQQFENMTNAQKIQAQKDTLSTIASLSQSNSGILFAIGKAASLSLAAINVAEGTTKALAAFPPPFNFIAASAVGAAGAIQIANIAAQPKPSAGRFAQGGIIGGNSPSGDQLTAQVNSKEMILNQRQQKNLFNDIDKGNLGGGGGNNITINNPVFLNEEGVDTTIDLINDRLEFGNKELKVS